MQLFYAFRLWSPCKGKTPAAWDMEATTEFTCTEGNTVGMVAVFGQNLRQKLTKIGKIFYKIKKMQHVWLYIMMYILSHSSHETLIFGHTSYFCSFRWTEVGKLYFVICCKGRRIQLANFSSEVLKHTRHMGEQTSVINGNCLIMLQIQTLNFC